VLTLLACKGQPGNNPYGTFLLDMRQRLSRELAA
jgi:hypothetical protein